MLVGYVWRFGGVVAGVLGKCGACGVCSRLLEMADFRFPLRAGGTLRRGSQLQIFVNFGLAIRITARP